MDSLIQLILAEHIEIDGIRRFRRHLLCHDNPIVLVYKKMQIVL